jgi:hypothetical protein
MAHNAAINLLDNTLASFEAATTRRYSNHCVRMRKFSFL